jgi:molybdate transport system substrate-binding protein
MCWAGVSAAWADETLVAVASNFTAPMKEITTAFNQSSGHRVQLAFGSSGKFYAQIRNGAPFQAFFSADQAKPAGLEEAGFVVAGSRFTYAVGALALWSAKPDFVDGEALVLKHGGFNKLAMANPKLAPYGVAAVEVLQHLGLQPETRRKWVQGENIAQTYQFVASGNADLGFVSLSQVMRAGSIERGSAWIVPDALFSAIRQDAVLLPAGEHNQAARELLQFVRGDVAGAIMRSYGYLRSELQPQRSVQ